MNATAVLAAAMMGIVLVTVDMSAVNVAAPALGRSFHTGLGGMEWVLNVYSLAYAACLLNAAALSDRHGPRATFLAGFALAGGPILAGALIAAFGWRGIFLINLLVGAAGLWLTWAHAPFAVQAPKERADWPGQSKLTIALAGRCCRLASSGRTALRRQGGAWPLRTHRGG